MSQGEAAAHRSVSFLCDCLGITRQGYYTHSRQESDLDVLRTSIVLYCQHIRADLMPRAGMRELYVMCRKHFCDRMTIGRDQCYDLFRANGLVLRKKKRPRTTDSRHNFHIYPDLLNVTPKLTARHFGELAVADITYVETDRGWAYLSLLMDAATRMIVGYKLHPTLETAGPLAALGQALDFYKSRGIATDGLIHHSDRGIQYCSNAYVNVLLGEKARISMTQTGDPLHNAMAERLNNTIKNGWLFDCEGKSFDEVEELIDKAVKVYNGDRPHQALGMRTPRQAMDEALLSCGAVSSPYGLLNSTA